MALITKAIDERAFEKVRTRIGEILATELPNMATLKSDPEIDVKVWSERFVPFGQTEVPAVNIYLAEVDFNNETIRRKTGEYSFNIDVHYKADNTATDRADTLAMSKLQKLVGVIDGILSNNLYITLGFDAPFISSTTVKGFKIAQPDNNKDAKSAVMARITFVVKVQESNKTLDAILIEGYDTVIRLDETEFGYFFSTDQDTNPPLPPLHPDSILNVNSEEPFVLIPAGNFFDLEVRDTANSLVGFKDGNIWRVPAATPSVHNYKVLKTNSTPLTSRFPNDDGDLQMGEGSDRLTLSQVNFFNNLDRFTDRDGAQLYPDGIVLDWTTEQLNGDVLAYQKTAYPNTHGNLNVVLASTPLTFDGFNGWFVANENQLHSISKIGGTSLEFFDYPPFNYVMTGNNGGRMWTSTSLNTTSAVYYIILPGLLTRTNYFAAFATWMVRQFNTSEL